MGRELTDHDKARLRAFVRQVERLFNSNLIKKHPKIKMNLNFRWEAGKGAVSTFEGHDPDLFQAQMPIFRQFVENERDPVYFYSICQIIKKACTRPELVAWTDFAHEQWGLRLKALSDTLSAKVHNVDKNVEKAINNFFYGYGGLFHVNLEEPDQSESVKAVEREMIETSFVRFCNLLNIIRSVIHWWLDAPTEKVQDPPKPEAPKEPTVK